MGFFSDLFGSGKKEIPMDPDELAKVISADWADYWRGYINNTDDAYHLAFQFFALANSAYNHNRGGAGFPTEDQYPASIKRFFYKVYDKDDGSVGGLKEEYRNLSPEMDMHRIHAEFRHMTSALASHEEHRLKVNYAVIENIIRDWNLDK